MTASLPRRRRLIPVCASTLLLAGALWLGSRLSSSLPIVDGAVPYKNSVQITTAGEFRQITSNGIPDHSTGKFPNGHNPNTIRPQNYRFRVPLTPKIAARITPLPMQDFGVALNGVPFDPFAAEWWNQDRSSGWQIEPLSGAIDLGLDQSRGHVQPTGAYHYHGLPQGLITRIQETRPAAKKSMLLLGYAADGFPIYSAWGHENPQDANSKLVQLQSSYRVREGQRPDGPGGTYDGTYIRDYEYVRGAGDLDECNGRTGVTPEYPEGTYHYFLTEQFPYIPRYFRGTPDASFRRGPPGGGPGMGFGPPRGGPPPGRGPSRRRQPPRTPPLDQPPE